LPYVSNFKAYIEEIEIDCLKKKTQKKHTKPKNCSVSKYSSYNGYESLVATSLDTRTYFTIIGLFRKYNDLQSVVCSVQNGKGSLVFVFTAILD